MRWPLIIVGFFVVLISVNALMLTLALWGQEDTVRSYAESTDR